MFVEKVERKQEHISKKRKIKFFFHSNQIRDRISKIIADSELFYNRDERAFSTHYSNITLFL